MSVERAFEVPSIVLDDKTGLVTFDIDPTTVGFNSPIGSFGMRTTGEHYRKTGALDTDWKLIGAPNCLFFYNRVGAREDITIVSKPPNYCLLFFNRAGISEDIIVINCGETPPEELLSSTMDVEDVGPVGWSGGGGNLTPRIINSDEVNALYVSPSGIATLWMYDGVGHYPIPGTVGNIFVTFGTHIPVIELAWTGGIEYESVVADIPLYNYMVSQDFQQIPILIEGYTAPICVDPSDGLARIYDGSMTPGDGGAVFGLDLTPTAYGSVLPTNIGGTAINILRSADDGTSFLQMAGGVEIPGIAASSDIYVSFTGFIGVCHGTIRFNWSVGDNGYNADALYPALSDYLEARVGLVTRLQISVVP